MAEALQIARKIDKFGLFHRKQLANFDWRGL